MANLNSRLVLRNDVLTNWESLDLSMIPFKGEALVVFDGDKTRLKIGDGIHSFIDLPWFGENGNIDIEPIKTEINELAALVGQPADENLAATGLFAALEEKANLSEVYTKAQTDAVIAQAIQTVNHIQKEVVDVLPDEEDAADNVIYLVPSENGYDEYLVINGKWELIGNTTVDLSGYVTDEELASSLNGKVDKVDGQRLLTKEEGDALAALMNGNINAIQSVSINGVPLEISEEKNVDLPIASTNKLGVVKGAEKVNQANIMNNGEISINNITFDHIVNGTNEVVINCGNAFGY